MATSSSAAEVRAGPDHCLPIGPSINLLAKVLSDILRADEDSDDIIVAAHMGAIVSMGWPGFDAIVRFPTEYH